MFGGLIPFKLYIESYDYYTYNRIKLFFEKIKNVYGIGLGNYLDNKNIYNNIILNGIEFNYLRDVKSRYGKDSNITDGYYSVYIEQDYLKIFEMFKRGNINYLGEKTDIPFLNENNIDEYNDIDFDRIKFKLIDDNEIFNFNNRYFYMYEKNMNFEDAIIKEIKNKRSKKINDIMRLLVEYYDGDVKKTIDRIKDYYKEIYINKEKILKKKQFYLYEFVDKIFNEFDNEVFRVMGKVVLPIWLIYKLIKENIGLNIYIVDIEYKLLRVIDVLKKEVNGYVYIYRLNNEKKMYLIVDDEQEIFIDKDGKLVSKILGGCKKLSIKNIVYGDMNIEYVKRIKEEMFQFILDSNEKIIFDYHGNMYKYIKRIDDEFYF